MAAITLLQAYVRIAEEVWYGDNSLTNEMWEREPFLSFLKGGVSFNSFLLGVTDQTTRNNITF
jgi:hypothetical protein